MAQKWGSPADRVLGRAAGAVFLGLITVTVVVPGTEQVLNTLAGWAAALGLIGLACYLAGFVAVYLAGERRARWECIRPLDGLTDPDTGKRPAHDVRVD